MSRTVLRYVMHGVVEINGARYFRICDMSNVRALDFLKKPAALVLIDPDDRQASFDLARVVWNALNDAELHRVELARAVSPAERSALLEDKR